MTKKLPPEKKKKRGRPSLYNPDIHPKKAGDLALMGKDNIELAEALGVNQDTLNQWRKQFPEFADAVKKNKDQADSVVVGSLYQRAIGYEYTEKRETVNPDGSVTVQTTVKHVAPDVTAQIYWLKCRQPQDWRDRQIHEITGKDGAPLIPEKMTDAEVMERARGILARK